MADFPRTRSIGAHVLALAVCWAAAAAAQTPSPPRSPFATVRGYVFDSLLTVTTLGGAVVDVAGPVSRTTTADARGRFGFDSLPPGRYVFTFSHPSLDEIGYPAPSRTFDLPAGVVTRPFLATAAGAAIAQRLCPGPNDGLGALVGSLHEVRSKRPVPGGEIRIEWAQTQVSQAAGVTRQVRAAVAATDSSGRFRVCGLPNTGPLLLRTKGRGVAGPPLELDLGAKALTIRNLSIDLADSAGTVVAGPRTAVLKGVVRRENGLPLAGAQVLVLGSLIGTDVGPTGAFELDTLPGGTHLIEIRAIGYQRRRETVELDPERPASLEVTMKQVATVLQELNVTAKAPEKASEFDARKSRNNGGYFITQEEIDRRNPLRTEDLFRTIPGLTLVPSGGFNYKIVSNRGVGANGQCSPEFFIDGIRTQVDPEMGGGIPASPGEIYGIEVYNSSTMTPSEFQTQNSCGAVVIWTRRGGPRKK